MSESRKILEITSYPPPRAGWGVRVEFLKRELVRHGHQCVVLNIGRSRHIPSPEYETVLGAADYIQKVWRFTRLGFVAHVHVNATAIKGFILALAAELLNLLGGRRCYLTFHAGIDQPYFPRPRHPWLWPMYLVLFGIPRAIICNSEGVKRKICEYGIPSSKVVVIPAFSRQYLEFQPMTLGPEIEEFFDRTGEVLFSYIRVRPVFNLDTLVDGFATLAPRRPRSGLLLCGVSGDIDDSIWMSVTERIAAHNLEKRVCVVDDLDHDSFMTVLGRSSVYVRTPTSDGVASSVLEALALRVPVVAAENGSRPPGVITYPAKNPSRLAEVLNDLLQSRDLIASTLPEPEIKDTLQEEIRVLTLSR